MSVEFRSVKSGVNSHLTWSCKKVQTCGLFSEPVNGTSNIMNDLPYGTNFLGLGKLGSLVLFTDMRSHTTTFLSGQGESVAR